MSKLPICSYCKSDKDLCASHSIPDAFFKLISRKNSGKLISVIEYEGILRYTSETGKSKLLCADCEGHFNRKFDSPLVNLFKSWDRRIISNGFGERVDFSPNHLAQSLASIFWRAALSGNDFYANAKVSKRDEKELLEVVKGEQGETLTKVSCSISRLYDRTPPHQGSLSQEVISQIIFPVNAYRIGSRGAVKQHFAFSAIMQGFLCTVILPRLPFSKQNKPMYLRASKARLHAPPLHFLDYKPLASLAISAALRDRDGVSKASS